jgi:hypothetical protein
LSIDTATLYSGTGDWNTIATSLVLDPSVDTLTFDLEIPGENSAEDGVDISQTTATLDLVVDFDSDKDISNMVFYLGSEDSDDCVKLKIDGFDEYWENLNGAGYDTTSTFDMMIDDATLKGLFNQFCGEELDQAYDIDGDGEWENDWNFGGFSTKAGNNRDTDYAPKPNQARGKGEYIGSSDLADACYGEAADCEIDAAHYDVTSETWMSNIDDLFNVS